MFGGGWVMRGGSGPGVGVGPQEQHRGRGRRGVRDTRRTSAGYGQQRAAGREQPAREEERSPGLGVSIARGEPAARPCAGRHVARGDGGTGRVLVGR